MECLIVERTSLSKLARQNSSELNRALVAANLTWLLGSSFFMPCTMAVRMSLAFSSRHRWSMSCNSG